MKSRTVPFLLALIVMTAVISCTKTNNPGKETNPTKFVDLKIDPNFDFDNFKNLEAIISVPASRQSSMSIVQIFDGNPATGGRLIQTGSLDQNNVFNTQLRIPSGLEEVYIGKVSSDGLNEYVAVPVSGNTIDFSFGATKELKNTEEILDNDCNDGSCTQTVSGTNSNLTINAGDFYCVAYGTNAVFNNLEIKNGGTLRICGTATVNSYQSGGGSGNLIVTPSGTINLPKQNNEWDIENYGSFNMSGGGTTKIEGTLENWGTVMITNKFTVEGDITNHGSFTVTKDFKVNSGAEFLNNCSLYVTEDGNEAFSQNGKFTNNGYVSVDGTSTLTGNGSDDGSFFGLQSLFETAEFEISGDLTGPASQGSQIHALESNSSGTKSKVTSGADVTGYVDLWAGVLQVTGNPLGPNVTQHDPGYTITAPVCNMPAPPVITSSLQIGGLVNQTITPYVITATGSDPITYTAANLPAGLSYDAASHTISGTPGTAGTFNVPLTADNFMGVDNKTLVITITQPTAPPVITSVLTAQATVGQSFSYLMTASGTGPITYAATNLPAGLSFDSGTQLITGTPAAAGTYNITLTATNAGGSDIQVLVLTVGTPPDITSGLTATGTVGLQFNTYTVTGTGSPSITYNATNLPNGLVFNASTNEINGTPTAAGVTNVTLTAVNAYGTDTKILVITIDDAPQAPAITSPLQDVGTVNQAYSYTITATGDDPISYNATGLPPGCSFSGATISGLPTTPGTFFATLTATNGVGTDTQTLTIVINGSGSGQDTDGDGVPDNIDDYPTDPDRAFNSYYPNQVDFGSFVFEDLWPFYGDYDMNDLVVNFNFNTVTNASNKVVDVIAQLQIMAAGATFNNGFGLVLNTPGANIGSVSGCIKMGNAVNIDPLGFETGHTNQTVIIAFDAINDILGSGMINTVPGGVTVQTTVQTITIHLSNPQSDIGLPPYNPFIFVDQSRGVEVHLKDQAPTELVDETTFGSGDDATDAAQGHYYRSTTGLPWGIEVPKSFDYPVEKVDVLLTYLHFAAWAQSSGTEYPDWYEDYDGYRDDANLYINN